MKIAVKNVASEYGFDTQKQFFEKEIQHFMQMHQWILSLDRKAQIQKMREMWSLSTFWKLIEILCFLGKQDTILSIDASKKPNDTDAVREIRNAVFGQNSTEALLDKFIRPRWVMEKDIDYSYDDFQLSRYGDFTAEPKQALEKMMLLTNNSSFLMLDENHSPERLRRERKNANDIMFTCIMRHPSISTHPSFRSEMMSQIDKARNVEIEKHTDTEYWSVHHVLYGLISGTDDYATDPWLNPHSEFFYINLIVPALSLLLTR